VVKVLITDGGYKHTLGIVRSLSLEGYVVDCIGSHRSVCRFSRFLNTVAYSQDRFNDADFPEFISFLEASDYSVIVAVGGASVDLLSRNRTKIPKHVSLILAESNSISICLDKRETLVLAAKLNIPYPKTWLFSDYDEYLGCSDNFPFPLVVKGGSELEKFEPLYVHNREELDSAVHRFGGGAFPIIQQYVHGVGVGFFGLYENGTLRRHFMHQRVRENPPSGGASCCAISIFDGRLYGYGKALLDSLNWHGVAMVEFKRDELTGDFYLMEINPKFWGSHDLAISAGVNFAKALVELSAGNLPTESQEYIIGLKYHWPLEGDFQHLSKKPSSIVSVLSDVMNPRVKSNLWISDPLPWLYLIAKLLAVPLLKLRSIFFKHILRSRQIGIRGATVRGFTELSGIPIFRYSKVTDNVYVGMQQSRLGKVFLSLNGFDSILNLRSEFDDSNAHVALSYYLRIPIDEFTAPTVDQLRRGVDFVSNVVSRGSKVYIHCREGVSRAPLFAAAFLISNNGYTISEAIAKIKSARFFINILDNQLDVLREYEKRSHSRLLEV
jgi:predicted ATP-grasp superfamily ATP-dependent carboligase